MYPTLRKVFEVQLYKNNARALLLRIFNILNSDWLHHALSVRGVYESIIKNRSSFFDKTMRKRVSLLNKRPAPV